MQLQQTFILFLLKLLRKFWSRGKRLSIRLRNYLPIFVANVFTKRWIEPYYVSLSLFACPWIIIIITVNVIFISNSSNTIFDIIPIIIIIRVIVIIIAIIIPIIFPIKFNLIVIVIIAILIFITIKIILVIFVIIIIPIIIMTKLEFIIIVIIIICSSIINRTVLIIFVVDAIFIIVVITKFMIAPGLF